MKSFLDTIKDGTWVALNLACLFIATGCAPSAEPSNSNIASNDLTLSGVTFTDAEVIEQLLNGLEDTALGCAFHVKQPFQRVTIFLGTHKSKRPGPLEKPSHLTRSGQDLRLQEWVVN